jgi:hypothetical protein
VRSRLDLGFIISLPFVSTVPDPSVETMFAASAEVETVDAACTNCSCLTAEARRTYVALGDHAIIHLKRFRYDTGLKQTKKVTSLHAVMFSPL